MFAIIIDKIINFITENPIEHITAASVIFKIMEDILAIQKNELLKILDKKLYQNISNIDIKSLIWENPLANGIISNDNELNILDRVYENFIKPANNMIVKLPELIQKQYILNVISNYWTNPAFISEFRKNKVKEHIAEWQSAASADRIGKGNQGKQPDFMHLIKWKDKIFELVFGEYSRIICNDIKKKDNGIKLWKEINDDMYWIRKLHKPEKKQFSIIGIQVARSKIQLNVLMTDKFDINQYYHLQVAEIPIQKTEKSLENLPKFVKLLLNLRNIVLVNLSLLTNAPKIHTRRIKTSSTISSPRRNESFEVLDKIGLEVKMFRKSKDSIFEGIELQNRFVVKEEETSASDLTSWTSKLKVLPGSTSKVLPGGL
ncbi:hypothetical protein C1645_819357 [Glomus cerebriforme]|uniref:Uncharacterized protein n=1 Tax=Glomus cerebriforme TaxID=658196 RepID=A0A397T5P3_9GLOM|nr:hypothetical protein C1645_819357 [Glomus cerebriforme]